MLVLLRLGLLTHGHGIVVIIVAVADHGRPPHALLRRLSLVCVGGRSRNRPLHLASGNGSLDAALPFETLPRNERVVGSGIPVLMKTAVIPAVKKGPVLLLLDLPLEHFANQRETGVQVKVVSHIRVVFDGALNPLPQIRQKGPAGRLIAQSDLRVRRNPFAYAKNPGRGNA